MQIISLKYSIPYLILITYFILLVFTEFLIERQTYFVRSNRLFIRTASFIGLLFFFGFRGFIGWDWYLYYPAFNKVHTITNFDPSIFKETHFDHGFIYYMSFLKTIWNNFHFFIFVNTLIDLFILDLLIQRYSKSNYAFVFLLFIVMGGFYMETDILRSTKSLMLFLLSLKYLYDRKPIPYFLLNFIGCTFHLSAIVYLPMYFLLHKKIPKLIVIIIFLVGFIIFFFQLAYLRPFLIWISTIMGEKYLNLLNKYLNISLYSTSYGFTIGLIERIITVCLIIIYYDKILKESNINKMFINSYLVYFIFFFYFAEIKIIPFRVGGLFVFSYWFLYPKIIKVMENINNKIIVLSVFSIYGLIKIGDITNTILCRYVNVLFANDSFESRVKIFEYSLDTLLK